MGAGFGDKGWLSPGQDWSLELIREETGEAGDEAVGEVGDCGSGEIKEMVRKAVGRLRDAMGAERGVWF